MRDLYDVRSLCVFCVFGLDQAGRILFMFYYCQVYCFVCSPFANPMLGKGFGLDRAGLLLFMFYYCQIRNKWSQLKNIFFPPFVNALSHPPGTSLNDGIVETDPWS